MPSRCGSCSGTEDLELCRKCGRLYCWSCYGPHVMNCKARGISDEPRDGGKSSDIRRYSVIRYKLHGNPPGLANLRGR